MGKPRSAMQVLEEERAARFPPPVEREHSLVAVVFKDEDQLDGESIGPVWSRDREGVLRPHAVSPATGGARWFSRRQALAIAELCGLEFEEV